ncbi:hypothetical protein MKS88_004721 [Plasmodium brasilianum]|uniref:Pv-fam-d protein n=3 Tax=Plasmodium (Plasmodium) TaxID=418103 RepID=A0A1D3PB25_PLAMA|nr:Plasmodium exported protein, unknown function [Plasmodium malariae]KAI4835511.1 hypothetical protein MKS88_004721 [Plasmodium brasilianum]SCN12453.1 Plasmodium exported protein, unknown function [Plasmodium malariae]
MKEKSNKFSFFIKISIITVLILTSQSSNDSTVFDKSLGKEIFPKNKNRSVRFSRLLQGNERASKNYKNFNQNLVNLAGPYDNHFEEQYNSNMQDETFQRDFNKILNKINSGIMPNTSRGNTYYVITSNNSNDHGTSRKHHNETYKYYDNDEEIEEERNEVTPIYAQKYNDSYDKRRGRVPSKNNEIVLYTPKEKEGSSKIVKYLRKKNANYESALISAMSKNNKQMGTIMGIPYNKGLLKATSPIWTTTLGSILISPIAHASPYVLFSFASIIASVIFVLTRYFKCHRTLKRCAAYECHKKALMDK